MVVLRYIDAVAYSGLSMPPRRAGGLAVSATKFGDTVPLFQGLRSGEAWPPLALSYSSPLRQAHFQRRSVSAEHCSQLADQQHCHSTLPEPRSSVNQRRDVTDVGTWFRLSRKSMIDHAELDCIVRCNSFFVGR